MSNLKIDIFLMEIIKNINQDNIEIFEDLKWQICNKIDSEKKNEICDLTSDVNNTILINDDQVDDDCIIIEEIHFKNGPVNKNHTFDKDIFIESAKDTYETIILN